MLTLQTELAARTRYKRVKLALVRVRHLSMQLGHSREENTMDFTTSTMIATRRHGMVALDGLRSSTRPINNAIGNGSC
jgi:hypothetical protein